jgi:hypothetical protein
MKSVKTILAAALLVAGSSVSQANGDVELVGLMTAMQTFAHKVSLSLDAKNKELVGLSLKK